ncbi:YdcF family protein [Asaia astilbis]|uniref:YdcF family protein n=1 Tax=Asaia astilbis TaxID=610244 RepID=UPI0004719363|nr:YdcF family protein [Asaia astilbis]
MSQIFPELAASGLGERADRVATFLALTNTDDAPNRIDLIILAGNGVLACVDHAATLARHHGCLLLITGGVGHSTKPLAAALSERLGCAAETLKDLSEADLLSKLIVAASLLPSDQIILERHSTNTGENAKFSRDLLAEMGLKPHHIVLIQDPLLQRRTEATFRHHWQAGHTSFFSSPPFIPLLGDVRTGGSWTEERYLSLLLGEIPRLHDTPEGYGPRGKGFIGHVEIPQGILDDHAVLTRHFTTQAGR